MQAIQYFTEWLFSIIKRSASAVLDKQNNNIALIAGYYEKVNVSMESKSISGGTIHLSAWTNGYKNNPGTNYTSSISCTITINEDGTCTVSGISGNNAALASYHIVSAGGSASYTPAN